MEFNKEKFRKIINKDIEINTYVDGSGPLVIMVHGWPESWYSWRHQINYLVENGFSVAVPDMRGYGLSSKPFEIESYNIMELTSDVIAIADTLGKDTFNLIDVDGLLWTGFVYKYKKFWPIEKPSWTAGAAILAGNSLNKFTNSWDFFNF